MLTGLPGLPERRKWRNRWTRKWVIIVLLTVKIPKRTFSWRHLINLRVPFFSYLYTFSLFPVPDIPCSIYLFSFLLILLLTWTSHRLSVKNIQRQLNLFGRILLRQNNARHNERTWIIFYGCMCIIKPFLAFPLHRLPCAFYAGPLPISVRVFLWLSFDPLFLIYAILMILHYAVWQSLPPPHNIYLFAIVISCK